MFIQVTGSLTFVYISKNVCISVTENLADVFDSLTSTLFIYRFRRGKKPM